MKKRLLTLCVLLLSGTLFTACGKPDDTGGGDATCRNNKLDSDEICDDTVEGHKCPANQSACDEIFTANKKKNACLKELKFSGDPATCSAKCEEVFFPANECDRAVGKKCGDGVKDDDTGEKCDKGIKGLNKAGRCLAKNECVNKSHDACRKPYTYSGRVNDCTAECVEGAEVTDAINGDGCCPDESWPSSKDSDCADPVNMGEVCTNDKECQKGDGGASAVCLFYNGVMGDAAETPGSKGVCTRPCGTTNPCGDASKFACNIPPQSAKTSTPTPYCFVKGCTTAFEPCGGTNYTCAPLTAGNTCIPAFLPSDTNTNIGAACTADSDDCGTGGICIPQTNPGEMYTGGLCVSACGDVQNLCPDGSVCSIFPLNGASVFLCQKYCQQTTDCRPGYECSKFGTCWTMDSVCQDSCGTDKRFECLPSPNEPGVKRCRQVGTSETKNIGAACRQDYECYGGENALCQTIALENDKLKTACQYKCTDDTDCDTLGTGYACVETDGVFGRKSKICQKECTYAAEAECTTINPSFKCNRNAALDKLLCSVGNYARSPHYGDACNDDAICQEGSETKDGFCLKKAADDTTGYCSAKCATKTCDGFGENVQCITPAGNPADQRCVTGCDTDADCKAKSPDWTCTTVGTDKYCTW